MTPCQSSLLCGYAYDPEGQVLSVQFKEGGPIYRYSAFPPEKFASFEGAESKGKFFLSEVKGKYEFTKVEPVKEESDDDGA